MIKVKGLNFEKILPRINIKSLNSITVYTKVMIIMASTFQNITIMKEVINMAQNMDKELCAITHKKLFVEPTKTT